jgi:hypothetical protein
LGGWKRPLQAVQGRLQAIEGKPALQATPEDCRRQIDEAGRVMGEIAAKPDWDAARAHGPSNWWGPNPACVEAMIRDVGFTRVTFTPHPTIKGRGAFKGRR